MDINDKRKEILEFFESKENLLSEVQIVEGEVFSILYTPFNLKLKVLQNFVETKYCFRNVYEIKCNVEYFEVFILEESELESVRFKFYYEDVL